MSIGRIIAVMAANGEQWARFGIVLWSDGVIGAVRIGRYAVGQWDCARSTNEMDESIDNTIDREFARVTRLITVALVALVTLEIAVFVVVFAAFGVQTAGQWLPELVLTVLFSVLLGAIPMRGMGPARPSLTTSDAQPPAQLFRDCRAVSCEHDHFHAQSF